MCQGVDVSKTKYSLNRESSCFLRKSLHFYLHIILILKFAFIRVLGLHFTQRQENELMIGKLNNAVLTRIRVSTACAFISSMAHANSVI